MQAKTWETSVISPAFLCPILSSTGLISLQMVFRPPLDLYDVLIHLNPNQIPRHLEGVDRPLKSFTRGVVKNSAAVKILFPVVDYDPVQCYLQELRVSTALWRDTGDNLPKEELPSVICVINCLPLQELVYDIFYVFCMR